MKKMLKNNKGFTLIELLAVIVVLAVIMVIATQQVNSTIKKSRANSFVSSYKMIVKEIKSRMVMNDFDSSSPIVCTGDECITSYDLSGEDYQMTVSAATAPATGYDLTLTAKDGGKFANMELSETSVVKCPVSGACKDNKTISVNINSDGKVTKK